MLLSFDVDLGLTTSLVKNSGGLKTRLPFLCNLSDVSWLSTLIFFFPLSPPLFPFAMHEAFHSCRILYTNRQTITGRKAILLIIRPPSVSRSHFPHICSHVGGLSTKKKQKHVKEENISLYAGPDTILHGTLRFSWTALNWKSWNIYSKISIQRLYCSYPGVWLGVTMNLFWLFLWTHLNWMFSLQNIRVQEKQFEVLRTILTFLIDYHVFLWLIYMSLS